MAFWKRKQLGKGPRLGLAAALSVTALVVFGVFGGLGYASDAVSKATGLHLSGSSKSAGVHGFAAEHKKGGGGGEAGKGDEGDGDGDEGDEGDEGESPSENQYEGKTTICHHTHSKKHPWVLITVSNNALKAHKKHGDTLPNPNPPPDCPGPAIP
jgi:hypothetical protein